jgi:hypothetical protein
MIRDDSRNIFPLYLNKHQIVSEDAYGSTSVTPTEDEEHDETDMSNPEENREVQIGRAIVEICKDNLQIRVFREIEQLANELIQMHQAPK